MAAIQGLDKMEDLFDIGGIETRTIVTDRKQPMGLAGIKIYDDAGSSVI